MLEAFPRALGGATHPPPDPETLSIPLPQPPSRAPGADLCRPSLTRGAAGQEASPSTEAGTEEPSASVEEQTPETEGPQNRPRQAEGAGKQPLVSLPWAHTAPVSALWPGPGLASDSGACRSASSRPLTAFWLTGRPERALLKRFSHREDRGGPGSRQKGAALIRGLCGRVPGLSGGSTPWEEGRRSLSA